MNTNKTQLQVGGAILAAFFSAVSTALNAFNFAPKISWALISFISIVLFIFIVYWGWLTTSNRVKELEKSKPSIKVSTMRERQWCLLRVTNMGAEGDFRCQIQLTSNDPKLHDIPLYDGVWQNSGIQATLFRGQHGFIELADIQDSGHGLYLRFFQYLQNETNLISSVSGTQSIVQPNGVKYLPEQYEYRLSVTISSSPELKEEVWGHVYIFNINGFVKNPTTLMSIEN